ncbi:MAG: hypothetical protein GF403_10290 [Candidatus Coatesbacteria bacterium]|nr:hypothetical protein [Candidatus Coatesbacteria bacterium]
MRRNWLIFLALTLLIISLGFFIGCDTGTGDDGDGDTGAWHIVTVDSAGNVGRFSSLALDSAANPHISYYDNTYDNLKYAWRE